MVVAPPPIFLVSTAAVIFGIFLLGSAIKRDRRRRKWEERRIQLGTVRASQLHCPISAGKKDAGEMEKVIHFCSDPINPNSFSIFNDSNNVIYSLQRKSPGLQNTWVLANNSRLVVGEVNLTPGYLLNAPGRRQIATVELINPTLGLRSMVLKRRRFPGRPEYLDFDYLGTLFTWNKQNQILTAGEDLSYEAPTEVQPLQQASSSGAATKSTKILPVSLYAAEESTVAVAKSNKQIVSDLEVCYDPMVIDDEALIATFFVAIMTQWNSAVSLNRLFSLIKSASTKDTDL